MEVHNSKVAYTLLEFHNGELGRLVVLLVGGLRMARINRTQ